MNKFHPITILLVLIFAIIFLTGCSSPSSSWTLPSGSWAINPHESKANKKSNIYIHPTLKRDLDYYHNVYAIGKPKGQPVGLPYQYKNSDQWKWEIYP